MNYHRLFKVIVFLVAVNLLLAFSTLILTAQPPVTLTGILGYEVEDPQGFSGESRSLYSVSDEAGNRIELTIAPEVLGAAGGHFAVYGKRVQISLSDVGVRDGQAVVTALTPLNDSRWFTADPTGDEHWDNLLCKFSAGGSTPPAREFIIDLMDQAVSGMGNYWATMGRGGSTFSHTTTQWKTMPANITISSGHDPILNACLTLHGINPAGAYQVNTFYNANFGSARGGWNFLGEDKRFTWMPDWAYYGNGIYTGYSILAHEMGHAYGMPHGNNSDGDADPYDNPWDLMSGPSLMTGYQDGATYDYYLAKPMNNYYANQLSLIQNSDVFTYAGVTQEIILDNVGLAGTPNYFSATIPLAGGKLYSIETRMQSKGGYQAGFKALDNNQPLNGVLIYQIDPARTEQAWLVLGTTDATSGNAESILTVGESFTDSATNVTVTVLAETSNGFRISIGDPASLPFTQTSPAYNSTVETVFPTFEWDVREGATQYTLLVVSKTEGVIFKYSATVASATACAAICSFTPSDAAWKIKTGVKYQWSVKAKDASALVLASSPKWPLYFQALPTVITLNTPAENATVSGVTNFSWNDDPRVTHWTLTLKNRLGVIKFKQPYADADICNGTTCTVALDLTAFKKGAYTWRVKAKHTHVIGKKNSPLRPMKIQPVVSAELPGFRAP